MPTYGHIYRVRSQVFTSKSDDQLTQVTRKRYLV